MADTLGSVAGGAQKKERNKKNNGPGAFMNGHSMKTRTGQGKKGEHI